MFKSEDAKKEEVEKHYWKRPLSASEILLRDIKAKTPAPLPTPDVQSRSYAAC